MFRRPAVRRLVPAVLLACSLAVLPRLAAAQIREGIYDIAGTNPDGSEYQGGLALGPGPAGSWLARWQVGGTQLLGLGLIQGGVLAVSFVVDGRPGVAVYEVEPDGKLRGSWTTGGGLGTEILTPK